MSWRLVSRFSIGVGSCVSAAVGVSLCRYRQARNMNLLRNLNRGKACERSQSGFWPSALWHRPCWPMEMRAMATTVRKPANGTPTDAAKQPSAPAKSADKRRAKPSLEEELDEMRAQLRSQADQINRQQEEIDAMKRSWPRKQRRRTALHRQPQPVSAGAAPARSRPARRLLQ